MKGRVKKEGKKGRKEPGMKENNEEPIRDTI